MLIFKLNGVCCKKLKANIFAGLLGLVE